MMTIMPAFTRISIGVALLGFCSFLLASVETAQAQFPRYQSSYQAPYGPPISPYSYSSRLYGTSAYSNYSGTIVRRNQELQRSAVNHRRQFNLQQSQINNLRQDLKQSIAPTGSGGHFFDYSHYYNMGGRR